MEKITIGTKAKRLGIPRLSVGEGSKCRAVLLDKDPRMKYVAYDEIRKRRVEVDQDMVIKYGLVPSATYYYLVAKLNTDLNGTIVGDQFSVEYLQLSDSLNSEFADAVAENGIPDSIALVKIKKTGSDGRDYSYIKPTLSKVKPENPALIQKLEALRSNEQFLDSCWRIIDADTSMSKEKYEAMLAAEANEQPQAEGTAHRQIGQSPTVQSPMLTAQPTAQPTPQEQKPDTQEFMQSDDFGSEFNDF